MRKCIFCQVLQLCLRLIIFLPNGFTFAATPSLPAWDWKKTPNKLNWQTFMKNVPIQEQAIWLSIEKQNLHFEQLAWEWRTAWVDACAQSSTKLCGKILQLGLFDKALVVRAEAATKIGERFAGSSHAPALRLLETAFAVQQNKQGHEPLYVQYRILHAIKQIGGKQSISLGQKLARTSRSTTLYWSRLTVI